MIPGNMDTYVEVFGGAMWLYWMNPNLPVKTNVYNDFNRHLANVFLCSATDAQHFESVCQSYYKDIGNGDQFITYRDEVFAVYDDPFPIPDYDMAAKYMLLQLQMFTGGNGLTAKTKMYHNPNYKPKFYTFVEKFQQTHYLERLKHLTVENMDCRDLIAKYDTEMLAFPSTGIRGCFSDACCSLNGNVTVHIMQHSIYCHGYILLLCKFDFLYICG